MKYGRRPLYTGYFTDTFNHEEYEYPTPRVYAFDMITQWLHAVSSTKTPSAMHISPLELRPYMFPSKFDYRFEYIPNYPHAHGDFGGVFVLKHMGKVQRVLAKFNRDSDVQRTAPQLAQIILKYMQMPNMRTVGMIRSSPLNHMADMQIQKIYRLGSYFGDLVVY